MISIISPNIKSEGDTVLFFLKRKHTKTQVFCLYGTMDMFSKQLVGKKTTVRDIT
jgi:hypothetical protein